MVDPSRCAVPSDNEVGSMTLISDEHVLGLPVSAPTDHQ